MPHKFVEVKEIPKRKYTKGSIYDDMLDDFIERDILQALIEYTKKSDGLEVKGTYLSAQLRKRIKERVLTSIWAKTVNHEAYLLKQKWTPEG